MAENLEDVRARIDEIDDTIHDLIMQRTKIVEKVRDLKQGQEVKIRPAREARILYRLIERHKGSFPKRELIRIWRELIVATLAFEGQFSVAVYAPEQVGGYWQLARNQYGSFSDMTGHASVRRVIQAVRSGEATVGILPYPYQGDSDPWWRHLVSTGDDVPRVIARLPFAGPVTKRTPQLEALVICRLALEPSGRDRTLLGIDGDEPVGIQRLAAACNEVGLPSEAVHDCHDEQRPEIWFHMVEVDDYVPADDPRIAALKEKLEDDGIRVVQLGGYAKPLTAAELEILEQGTESQ